MSHLQFQGRSWPHMWAGWAALAIVFYVGFPGPVAAQQPVVDRESGIAFPPVLTPTAGGPVHQLVGTATRERTIFRLKVYAYGLYVDAVAARAQLAAFAGRQVATLDRDRTFFQRLLELRIPLAMRLVTTRGLTGEALGDAFEEALKPRVQRAATALNMPGGEAALERFRAYFDVRELPVSTEIVFACGPSGSVITMVGARAPLEIESPALCWALFDVYLGDRAISAAGRRSLIGGFPTLLAGSR